ncbi:acyltransferase-domain-containing protein [Umbelopsis sp. PMI_123]|nr:acyltransferase-domain-containing protein [Umbelopsis sp. PMI_123]
MALSEWTPRAILTFILLGGFVGIQTSCVAFAEFLSFLIRPLSNKWANLYLTHLMELWVQHLVFMIQYFAPGRFVITVDKSCTSWTKPDGTTTDNGIEEMIRRKSDGTIDTLAFPPRLLFISNHQIYADWIYVWCIAHLANAHGSLKIILKDDLRKVPLAGWGMLIFDFIFMKRKLNEDQHNMISNLERAKKKVDSPMWLLLFPEGTVISHKNRKISKNFAEKNGYTDPKYQLLPRSTGLRICTNTLGNSVKYLYDATIGYSGIKAGDVPEEVYTLRSIFFLKRYPKKIHVHLRRYLISDIPTEEEAYAAWLRERWAEKDELLAQFYRTGSFPGEDAMVSSKVKMEREVDENTGDVRIVRAERDDTVYRSLEVPIKLKHTILDLTQVWFCLLPYVPIVNGFWAIFQLETSFDLLMTELLPIIYQVAFTVSLAYEEDFIDFIDAHANNMKAVRGFKRTSVYICDPDKERGFDKHDKLHRNFFVYYEVDDEESLQKWIQNEEPKIINDLDKLLKSDDDQDAITVDFRQVLNPLAQYKLSKQQKRSRAQ